MIVSPANMPLPPLPPFFLPGPASVKKKPIVKTVLLAAHWGRAGTPKWNGTISFPFFSFFSFPSPPFSDLATAKPRSSWQAFAQVRRKKVVFFFFPFFFSPPPPFFSFYCLGFSSWANTPSPSTGDNLKHTCKVESKVFPPPLPFSFPSPFLVAAG